LTMMTDLLWSKEQYTITALLRHERGIDKYPVYDIM
jgi:hypothetical protein